MADSAADEFECPNCRGVLEAPVDTAHVRCAICNWVGEVYLFAPAEPVLEAPVEAMPEEATCAHHPGKRAVDVCAGTGDYICSLCAIEIAGRVYSAEYINRAGADLIGQHLQRTLPRPDRMVSLVVLLMLVPCFWWVAWALVIWAAVLYVRMIRQYRTDALYQRVIGMGSLIAAPIVLIVASIIYATLVLTILTELL